MGICTIGLAGMLMNPAMTPTVIPIEYVWVQKSYMLVEAENIERVFTGDHYQNWSPNPVFAGPTDGRGQSLASYPVPLIQWIVGASADTQPAVSWEAKFNPLSQATINHVINLSAESIPAYHRLEFVVTRYRSIGKQEFELRDEVEIPGGSGAPNVTVKRDRDWATFVGVEAKVYPMYTLPDGPPPSGPDGPAGGGL